ncbi:2'-5' RNA ligase family protein [Pseudonocardia acaciae]|uniref:2'-5' RNA ligase family protein n=1 Tax=Pseudonocardia acaciae TaxID=551276 RepID=UPI001B807FB2|nr:2'-5' RNA ligase family protein [Pseudonocardia acaciae]
MLLREHPEARAAAAEVAERLTAFAGLHMTPHEWLHVTTLTAGTTAEVSREDMSAMLAAARHRLSKVSPIAVSLRRILYHPEAIVLGIQPPEALFPVLNATRAATFAVTGRSGQLDGPETCWMPHMTVAYSTADQPAEPLISALGKVVRRRDLTIGSVSLIIQWGPERLWNWEVVGTVSLADD